MNNMTLKATGNHLEIIEDTYSTGGSVNYDKCSFIFDSEWTGFTKTAVFTRGNSDIYRAEISDNACIIPPPCLEKEGIIRIAVYGLNTDNITITTNSVAHSIDDGIENINEWSEDDFSLAQNAIAELKTYSEEFTTTLTNKFNSLLSMVEENGTVYDIDSSTVFCDEWYTPNTFTDGENCPIVSKGATYNDFLNYMIEPLVTAFPLYVSKRVIGHDTNEQYPVYAYTFEPENYEKTVLITTYIHGIERLAFYSLGYFLSILCNNYSSNSILNYIHSKIKLVVVPVVNPYGLINNKMYNSENVNIGLNFPYNWDSCVSNYKGTSAGDQKETQNIMTLLEELSEDKLCAVVDLHNSSTTVSGKTIFYPRFCRTDTSAFTKLINSMNSESTDDLTKTSILAASINPSLINYAAEVYSVNSCEIVWNNTIYGGIYSNNNITKLTEFIANTIFAMAYNGTYKKAASPNPFARYFTWNKKNDSDVFPIPATLSDMRISACSISLDSPCILTLNGSVTLNVTAECTVEIVPVLSQINSPEQDYNTIRTNKTFAHKLTLAPGIHVIPVTSVLQAYYTSYNTDSNENMFCGDVEFTFAFSASLPNSASVEAYSFLLNATPSDMSHPVEISSPMGNISDYENSDMPTQILIYPLGTYTEADKHFDD